METPYPKKVAMFSIHSDPLAPLGSQECGGQNIYVKYLAEELDKLGWHADIFTRRDNPHKKQIAQISKHSRVIRLKGGPASYIPKKDLFSVLPEIFENFKKFIDNRNPYSLFHGHYWDGGWMALEASRQFMKPFIENFHSIGIVRHETKKKFLNDGNETEYFQKRINLEKEIIKNSSYIISLAATEKENLEKLYNCLEEKIKVIKGGVNLKHWPHIEKEKARNAIGVSQKSFVILFVGRLEWRKGIGTLITAANLLKNEILNLKIVVVGGKIFGPNINTADQIEYKRLRQKAEEEGVKEIVSFCGNVDHERLPVYYRSADAFVIPSYYEPFGLVALEAMASFIPVIASRVDGLAATIKNGVTGLFFEARNPLSLKSKIMEIYNSRELADKLAENAHLEITKNYSWHTIAQKIAQAYEKLTDKTLTDNQEKYENSPTVSA